MFKALKDGDTVGFVLVLLLISFIGGCLAGVSVECKRWEKMCVERDVGHYESDRSFEWDVEEVVGK